VILAEHLEDRDYITRHTTGIAELETAVASWTPDAAAAATGLERQAIVDLAREYAAARPACIRHGVGMQRAAGAGMALRALQCLPAVTGHWRHHAGGIADARTIRAPEIARLMRPDLGPPAPRTINMIQLGRALTAPALGPPIRALYVWNSNPAVIAADQACVLRGLAREDLFTVVHEQFMTDTARWADIVLPAPTMLEQEDLVGSWGFHYVGLSERAIAPLGEAQPNAEVARRLAARLGFTEPLFRMTDGELLELALHESRAAGEGATLPRLKAEGFVRIGPARGHAPFADGGFPTSSGTFEFVSEDLARAGLGGLPAFVPPAESPTTDPDRARRFPLQLLTLKRHYSINSSYGALPVLLRAEPEPVLEMHPRDATARGAQDGRLVKVWNDRGAVTYRVRHTERLQPGMVAAPFGTWTSRGRSVNALTSDRLGDIGNGPTFCDTLVEVEALPDDA
jgi:anaerobic selenocysteine-containing dehydrogenase